MLEMGLSGLGCAIASKSASSNEISVRCNAKVVQGKGRRAAAHVQGESAICPAEHKLRVGRGATHKEHLMAPTGQAKSMMK